MFENGVIFLLSRLACKGYLETVPIETALLKHLCSDKVSKSDLGRIVHNVLVVAGVSVSR